MNNNSSKRVCVVDALRGFAIASLMLLHATQHFLYRVFPSNQPEWLTTINDSLRGVLEFLFTGKSYMIFALLFGFTFHLLYGKAKQRGGNFSGRYLWRLLILFFMGVLNLLFFTGDVLISYAVAGLILLPIKDLSFKPAMIIAVLLALMPGEIYFLVRSLLDTNYTIPQSGYMELYPYVKEGIESGSWFEMFYNNLRYGLFTSFGWIWDVGRVAQSAALFIVGYWVGKRGLFIQSQDNNKFWVRTLLVSFIGSALIYPILVGVKGLDQTINWVEPLVTIVNAWYDILFSGILVSLFVLLYNYDTFRSVCSPLAIYGRASLTNYIGQSIIGALLFFPMGLNLAPYLGMGSSIVVALVVIWVQIIITKKILRRYKRAPLETLWNRATWL